MEARRPYQRAGASTQWHRGGSTPWRRGGQRPWTRLCTSVHGSRSCSRPGGHDPPLARGAEVQIEKVRDGRGARHRFDECHHRSPTSGGAPQDGGFAECNPQQRELLDHRHRREGRHPALQRRRSAHAGLHGRRGRGHDHAGGHLRSAGGDRARQGPEPRAGHADHAGLRGAGLQGLARDRGHLRADLLPQGREPFPGGGVGHGAARRAGRHHRLPADRHRQHRAQAGRRGAAQGGGAAERHLQQRELLEHRHRRQGRHPDLQRRRRANARVRRGRGDEQDHAGGHLRSAGGDRARQGPEPRAGHADHAGLRGAGLQGLARDRGHLRADVLPQGREPVPGGGVGDGAARRAGRHHRLPADRHRQHRAQAGRGGAAQGGSAAERHLQQRELLEHRHRRQGRHPDLQRRRRANAGLRRRRGDEPDHAGGHLRSAGGDRARQGPEPRAGHADHAGLRGAGLQGLARHRGHLRADLHPQGREPLPGGGVGDGAARRPERHHRLPAHRHRQHRAQAGRGRAEEARPAPARPAILHALAHRIQHRRADDDRPVGHHHATSTSRWKRSPSARATS